MMKDRLTTQYNSDNGCYDWKITSKATWNYYLVTKILKCFFEGWYIANLLYRVNENSEWLLFNAKLCYSSAISWLEQFNFQWNDVEVHFVLDQHAELDFYSANSLKQQSADTLSRFRANKSLLFPLNAACLAEKHQLPIL